MRLWLYRLLHDLCWALYIHNCIPRQADRWRYYWQRRINRLGYTVYGQKITW